MHTHTRTRWKAQSSPTIWKVKSSPKIAPRDFREKNYEPVDSLFCEVSVFFFSFLPKFWLIINRPARRGSPQSFLRKGVSLAYVGSISNLKDLRRTEGRVVRPCWEKLQPKGPKGQGGSGLMHVEPCPPGRQAFAAGPGRWGTGEPRS
jgi:hypothetical protein